MAAHARPGLRGLYVILDPQVVRGFSLVEALRLATAGGARLFQYRDKVSSPRDVYRSAERLRQAADDAKALFVVNDRCDIAMAVDADGVHLGQDDLPVGDARAILGPSKLIGLSTHTAEQVRVAPNDADYLGFGPIFPSSTKRDHDPVVGIEGLRTIRTLTRRPIVAIGGIDVERASDVMAAGADAVAVISAIWTAQDPAAAVAALIQRLSVHDPPNPR